MSEPPDTPPPAPAPLAPLREYATLAAAREASLALAARSWTYEIDRAGASWLLLVEAPHHAAALEELALLEAEQQAPRPAPAVRPFGRFSPLSLFAAAAVLVGIFLLQERSRFDLLRMGDADSQAIIQRGAWWRCFTALTLHADLTHIVANLATGALFAGFLIPQLGTGWTWALVLLSGGLGNWLNSWGYRDSAHLSIGASTGVFAALGLLVAGETVHQWRTPEAGGAWRRLIAPIGAGLALLAFLGVGERHESIDFMAHAWGLFAGGLLGVPAAWARLRERSGLGVQWSAGLGAFCLLALSWWLALSHSSPLP